MTVLILAPLDDEHAGAVAGKVAAQGSRVEIVDLAGFPEHATLMMAFDAATAGRALWIATQGGCLDLDEVRAVWWRRPHYPTAAETMVRPSHRAFAMNETHEALGSLWNAMDARWINDPAADDAAARKGFQLATAMRLGWPIPRTVMTNDPEEARRFVDEIGPGGVVYKSFSSTTQEWRETRILKPEEVPLLGFVRHAPVIFQEYVPALYDLRVTVIGNEVFAAAIHSQETAYPVDSRIDIGNARIEAVELPDEIASRLIALTKELSLVYGAIDLRLTPDGQYVFLEINPAGQFTYIEAATGLPITSAMCRALTD